MESNDHQGHELDSLSSTRYLYNPQADSVRSIPAATLIRNDTKVSTNWKFTIMVIFITIVVSLLVSFIFDYYSNNQSNQHLDKVKLQIETSINHEIDKKLETFRLKMKQEMDQTTKNTKLELMNELHKEKIITINKYNKMVLFERDVQELKTQVDDMKGQIYLSTKTTTTLSTTKAITPLPSILSEENIRAIENKIHKMNESMNNMITLQIDQKSNQIFKIKESISNVTTDLEKLAGKVQNLENLENSPDQFVNRSLDEKYDHLETMFESTPLIPRNCFEYGLDISGYYTLNPERRPERSAKFKGFCSNGSTLIMHDHDDEINDITYCTDKNCYNLSLNYNIDMDQIVSLIGISDECSQTITFSCYISKFSQFASWTDRNGNHHQFFTNDSTNICECKIDDSCFKIHDIVEPNCNCDHGDVVRRQDEIKITNKDYLPMQSFIYGSMYNKKQGASVKIGPLICNGVKPMPLFAKGSHNPIGIIFPWTPYPDGSKKNISAELPECYVPCDGSRITLGVWKGHRTPDLNNSNRFLRGGSISEVLTLQDDAIQKHSHEAQVTDPGHFHRYDDKWPSCGRYRQHGHHGPTGCDTSNDRFDDSHWSDTGKKTTGIGVDITNNIKGAKYDQNETRPKNMKVVYVMRVC